MRALARCTAWLAGLLLLAELTGVAAAAGGPNVIVILTDDQGTVNGYATGHVGKWHLGFSPATMPLGQGFDFSFGHIGGCIDETTNLAATHGDEVARLTRLRSDWEAALPPEQASALRASKN